MSKHRSPRVATRALILHQGRLLLVNAYPGGRSDLWCAPGGGAEPGQSLPTNLMREVMEETGWHITGIRRLGAFRRFTYMPEYDLWAEKICTVYLARPTLQISPPTEDGHQAVWMQPEAALRLLGNAGDRAMLALALRQAGPR